MSLSTKSFAERCLVPTQQKKPGASATRSIISVAILAVWLAAVIFTTTRHEFWRDEVRAFSLARAATSPLGLFEGIKNEGHPLLWYLLLYTGKSIVNTPLVLPITSIAVAFAAVVVFMLCSPFPFWIRCLFIFGALPFYEYSVMARNYGISMLLLFVTAVLYEKRSRHPLLLGFSLGLLANTNVHSAILACLISGLWIWDQVLNKKTEPTPVRNFPFYSGLALVIAGLVLCVVVAMPREDSIVRSLDSSNAGSFANAFFKAVFQPGEKFSALVPWGLPSWVAGLLLWLALLGLCSRPALFAAGLAALTAFGLFFHLIYQGEFRHQGLFLVFLVFLYWRFFASDASTGASRIKGVFFNAGFYIAMLALLVGGLRSGKKAVQSDIRKEASSSKAFAAFLKTSPTYRNAILVPEPDYFLESLPYYATNRIYIPREHRFGTVVSFTTVADRSYSLGQLLADARALKTSEAQPVLIVLGHSDMGGHGAYHTNFSYNKIFTSSADEVADFAKSTTLAAEFNSAFRDENYKVYSVK